MARQKNEIKNGTAEFRTDTDSQTTSTNNKQIRNSRNRIDRAVNLNSNAQEWLQIIIESQKLNKRGRDQKLNNKLNIEPLRVILFQQFCCCSE